MRQFDRLLPAPAVGDQRAAADGTEVDARGVGGPIHQVLRRILTPVVAVEDRDAGVIGERSLQRRRLKVLDIRVPIAGLGAKVAQLGQFLEFGRVFMPPADPGLAARMVFVVEVARKSAVGQADLGAFEQDFDRVIEIGALFGGRDHLLDRGEPLFAEFGDHDLHRRFVPAGMHHPQPAEVEPQR